MSLLLNILVVLLFVKNGIGLEDCKLPLPRLSFFAPLIFSSNGTLRPTESNDIGEDEIVRIPSGENIILSCNPNYLADFGTKSSVVATCKSDKILVINKEEKNFLQDLSCQVRSIEEILTEVDGCDPTFTSVEYGFTNPKNEKSYILGEACYDEKKGKTIFVHSKIQSKYSNENIDNISLRIKDKHHLRQDHPMSRYKLEYLRATRVDRLNERLGNQLGSSNVPYMVQSHFIGSEMLMNKQFYTIKKLAWNYVMMNSEEASANLEVLQDDILHLKSDYILDVYMGSHGVLNIPNKKGKNTPIYMNQNKFPVAKYIWIVVKSGDKAVAFTVLNSPNKGTDETSFCNSKCGEIQWLENITTIKNIASGHIQCCEYNEFRRNVPEVPLLPGHFELLSK